MARASAVPLASGSVAVAIASCRMKIGSLYGSGCNDSAARGFRRRVRRVHRFGFGAVNAFSHAFMSSSLTADTGLSSGARGASDS